MKNWHDDRIVKTVKKLQETVLWNIGLLSFEGGQH